MIPGKFSLSIFLFLGVGVVAKDLDFTGILDIYLLSQIDEMVGFCWNGRLGGWVCESVIVNFLHLKVDAD